MATSVSRCLLVVFLVSVTCSSGVIAGRSALVSDDEQTEAKAVEDLIWRLVPATADRFSVIVDRSFVSADGKEQFNLNSITDERDSTNVILITGTSGPAAANGFHFYLKYHLKMHVSWSGDQLTLPPTDLPTIINKTVILQDEFRYYFNVCTFRLVPDCILTQNVINWLHHPLSLVITSLCLS